MAGGTNPTTPILIERKILPFMVKVLKFSGFGRTNNCEVDILLKWSDQSSAASAAPVDLKSSDHMMLDEHLF